MAIDQIEIKRQLKYIKSQMYKPSLTEIEKEKLLRMGRFLVKNSSPYDNRANIMLAKLYYQTGNYSASREQYELAKKVTPHCPTIYYGLYKNYVMEENWKEALKNLEEYMVREHYEEKNLSTDGFDLPRSFLGLLNNEEFLFLYVSNDFYLYQEIKDDKLKEMYREIVKGLADENFPKAIDAAKKCEEYARDVGIPLEFITLEKILRGVLAKEINDYKKRAKA